MFLSKQSSLLLVFSSLLISSCSTSLPDPFTNSENSAFKTPQTISGKQLAALPHPNGKIAVAIYSFTDQTGQRKDPADGKGGTNSSAVTQGGTAILMQALQNSNWFTVLERKGLAHLSKARNIIRIANYGANLVPMKNADLLLEGGITGYASNTRTGGLGFEYFGMSRAKQYREDFVTVHLRAVDIASGQVVLSVSASRRLLSKEIRSGVFQYIRFKQLLGIEKGITVNEPSHICISDAIEKAVHDLIIEGILKGTWQLKNPQDINASSITHYKNELLAK
jgi:curli production assembly/transport component CsgG